MLPASVIATLALGALQTPLPRLPRRHALHGAAAALLAPQIQLLRPLAAHAEAAPLTEAAQPAAHPPLDTRHAPLAAVRGVGGFSPVVMAEAPGGASPVQHSPQNAFIPVRERYEV